jgi:hypothetical protein
MLGEIFGHRQRIIAMALHTERQCLNAGYQQEGVKRCQSWPKVAQTQYTGCNRESKIAEGIERLGQALRETAV